MAWQQNRDDDHLDDHSSSEESDVKDFWSTGTKSKRKSRTSQRRTTLSTPSCSQNDPFLDFLKGVEEFVEIAAIGVQTGMKTAMAIDEGLARAGLKKDEVKRGYAPPPRIDSDPYGSSLTRRQNLETNTLSPGASLGILLGGAVVGALVVSALAADNDKRKHYD